MQERTPQGNVHMNKKHRIQRQTGTRGKTYTNREQGQDVITSEFEGGMEVLGISEVMWK